MNELRQRNPTLGQISCLVNSDSMLILSENRDYFQELKGFYLKEIKRLSDINVDLKYKKKDWKERYFAKNDELLGVISRIEAEQEKRYNSHDFFKHVNIQTDLDQETMKKYYAAYDIHNDNKQIV